MLRVIILVLVVYMHKLGQPPHFALGWGGLTISQKKISHYKELVYHKINFILVFYTCPVDCGITAAIYTELQRLYALVRHWFCFQILVRAECLRCPCVLPAEFSGPY